MNQINPVNAKKKTRMVRGMIALAALLGIALLATLILWLVSLFLPDRDSKAVSSTLFYEADYDFDISQDEEYIALDRRVWVDDGLISQPIDNDDFSGNSLYLFLDRYFNALKLGDARALRSCYTDECVSALKIPARLTMQRVYDIVVTILSETEKTDADGIVYTEYSCRFEYKINKNDGVFRSDLASDAVRPQTLTIRVGFDSVIITDAITVIRK